ncbi:WPP domain-containing protein [Cinnamomum micranthum f. kanehirae]|uniref:WPP domain-containing protein n=1 Tax=Cinnamomum micranthum f. kanehirae TaxID=337451 RepID=A0A443NSB8_9MAGN|nr:WPP domain-containing protein [Cinnamomum micranthum f. kanehirae]
MAEEEEVRDQDLDDVSKREEEKKASMNASLSIWPPTQRTRDAVIKRMVETLSTPSTLSKRYGSIPLEDASAAARLIEEEAFSAASNSSTSTKPVADAYEDDGIEILQIYSKEISKRMLEAVKARAPPPSPSDHSQTTPPAPTAGEETSSFESESSHS